MLLAMCIDGDVIIAALSGLLLVGIACCALFVAALILIRKWANGRGRRGEAAHA